MIPPLNSRNIGGGHVCWGSYDGFNFAVWRSRCVPGMHRDHNAPACTASPHTLRLAVHAGALWAATAMCGKFGSEFET